MSSAMLMVLGDDLNPDLVSDRLGIQPDQVWRKGELKSHKRKDGSTRYFDSRYEWGGWKAFLKEAEHKQDLQDQIRIWCDRLVSKQRAIRELQQLNYRVVIDCCVSAPDFVHFDAKFHRQLAELNIDLDISAL